MMAHRNPQVVWSVQTLFPSDHLADAIHMVSGRVDVSLHRTRAVENERQIAAVCA
jgi:hypothetical protein